MPSASGFVAALVLVGVAVLLAFVHSFGGDGTTIAALPLPRRRRPLSIVVLGASGDLAKRKVFPALFGLHRAGRLSAECTSIVGYARSNLTNAGFRERLAGYLPQPRAAGDEERFLRGMVTYVAGPYDADGGLKLLFDHLRHRERRCGGDGVVGDRLFYLALPPHTFVGAARGIRSGSGATSGDGWTRLVLEKPFGRDTASSRQLAADLGAVFPEDENQVFRIDHYLGKPIVRDLHRIKQRAFGLRGGRGGGGEDQQLLWSRRHVERVEISLKETIGTDGRGGYFDDVGIIRDVMQNHLTQMLALVAMEPFVDGGDGLREAKVAALRSVRPVEPRETVLGQFTAAAGGSGGGYRDDATVPNNSTCATFASMVLWVDNERWAGVPFVMTAGKALDATEVAVRVRFRADGAAANPRFAGADVVFRVQPDGRAFVQQRTGEPGEEEDLVSEVDADGAAAEEGVEEGQRRPPDDAYEFLLQQVISDGGVEAASFVGADELDAAWRIFTPLLHSIDRGDLGAPLPYPRGSRGGPQALPAQRRRGRFE